MTRRIAWVAALLVGAFTIVLGAAAPAQAAVGVTRYSSFVSPHLCLTGDTELYVTNCNGGRNQIWHFTAPSENLRFFNDAPPNFCIEAPSFYLWPCGVNYRYQHFTVYGVNGHVVIRSQHIAPFPYPAWYVCLSYQPSVGTAWETCPRPGEGVANRFAWDYHPA